MSTMTPDVLTDTAERDQLALLAAAVPAGRCIVELGVFRGGSLAVLADAARVPVFGVDTFGGEGTPDYYLAGNGWISWWERRAGRPHSWSDNEAAARAAALSATVIVADTAVTGRVWTGPPVGLLYIDADHSYDGVRADWDAWKPHLAPDAVVVFDDYRYMVRGQDHYPGVTRFVDELGLPIARVGKAAVVQP